MATTINVRSIGTGGDFSTIQAWEAATRGDLVTLDVCEIGELLDEIHVINDGNVPTIQGSTTDPTHYRILRNRTPFNPVDRSGGCVVRDLSPAGDSFAIRIEEDYFELWNMGIFSRNSPDAFSTTGFHNAIEITALEVFVTNTYVRWEHSGATAGVGNHVGFVMRDGAQNSCFYNVIVHGGISDGRGADLGFWVHNTASGAGENRFYACAVYSIHGARADDVGALAEGRAFRRSTFTNDDHVNCVAVDCAVDYYDLVGQVRFCASGGSVAPTGTGNISGLFKEQAWRNADIDDFRQVNGSRISNVGTNQALTNYKGRNLDYDFDGVQKLAVEFDMGPYEGIPSVQTAAPTIITSTIGPGGGFTYPDVQTWEAATRKHLVAANEMHIGIVTTNSGAPWALVSGIDVGDICSVADATRFRRLTVANVDRFDPPTQNGVKFTSDDGFVFRIFEDFFEINGIGAENTQAVSAVDRSCFESNANNTLFDGCCALMFSSPAAGSAGFRVQTGQFQRVQNCIAIGPETPAGTQGMARGFQWKRATSVRIYNCVAYRCRRGGGGGIGFQTDFDVTDLSVINCIAADCDTDFSVNVTDQLFNISTDATALGTGSLMNQVAVNLFNEAAIHDLRLKFGSAAFNAGTDLSLEFTRDYENVRRRSPWDIGAFEGVARPELTGAVPFLSSMYLARCWNLYRRDGFSRYITEANLVLPFQGQLYTPIGSIGTAASESRTQFDESNTEAVGAFSPLAPVFDFEDIADGLWDEAVVEEFWVDYRFLFATPGYQRTWVINSFQTTEQGFKIQFAGLAHLLEQRIGGLYGPSCRYQLGEIRTDRTGCGVNLRELTQRAVAVTSVTDDQRSFEATGLIGTTGGYGDGWYNFGKLRWDTGNNVRRVNRVKTHVDATGSIVLQRKTAHPIQVGDTFTLEPGCDHRLGSPTDITLGDCIGKYSNSRRFGGEDAIVTSDRAVQVP